MAAPPPLELSFTPALLDPLELSDPTDPLELDGVPPLPDEVDESVAELLAVFVVVAPSAALSPPELFSPRDALDPELLRESVV